MSDPMENFGGIIKKGVGIVIEAAGANDQLSKVMGEEKKEEDKGFFGEITDTVKTAIAEKAAEDAAGKAIGGITKLFSS